MPWESLSNELLILIIEFVSIPRRNSPGHPNERCLGTEDLLSLIRCNRHFYTLGKPILYRHPVLKSLYGFLWFTKILLSQPDLLTLVRSVHITYSEPFKSRHVGDFQASDEETKRSREVFLDLARNLDPSLEGSVYYPGPTFTPPCDDFAFPWEKIRELIISHIKGDISNQDMVKLLDRMRYGSWNAWVAFTLSLLSKVEMLDMNVQISGLGPNQDDNLPALFQRAKGQYVSPLSNLNSLSISYSNRKDSTGISALVPYLERHNLRSFVGDQIYDVHWLAPPSIILHLTRLKIERSNFAISSLESLLRCCPRLEYLMYEHDQNYEEERFIPERFGKAISHLRGSLRELVLYRSEKGYLDPNVQLDEISIIGSLAGFEKLTNLSITAHLLLGTQKMSRSAWHYSALYNDLRPEGVLVECLPKSLETLKLKYCGDRVRYNILDLVGKRHAVPNLKILILSYVNIKEFQSHWYSPSERLNFPQGVPDEKLQLEFKAKGIELEVLHF